ncbi:lipopolysaccharide heptosyltransferase II [Aestuariirhabdus sp. Z084]|uniref:lipopolysaccharide heptosyltransferase II n=1 Tax=Aestuariirhabdus haliotis TaxID=2918751 RepID=UPI00201B3D43|nr:lipopolysaccharide heptosyltransferase II [Aestuariirhabdus haliotis]MCL6415588.1 lipopolysaccharide heptosyltransferase II [Aestuariirhabdus haliotis]MCL6419583.1 lipopolysaccharide heptosyltransferase II [Aestuariirhabdus haliotis]
MSTQALKILVIGPSWVGDMVMAQTLFMVLAKQHPGCAIDVLAPAWSRPLLERMPEVRRAIDMPLGHGSLQLGVRRQLGISLRSEAYDWAITLPNSLKSALVAAWAKIPRRTGWRGEMRYGLLNDLRVLDKARYPLMIERFIALGLDSDKPLPAPLPSPGLEIDPEQRQQALQALGLQTTRPILVLCPGAEFGEAKRWPEQAYAEVARKKLSEGWQVWILGSAKDTEGAERIRQMLPAELQLYCENLAGKTVLAQAVDLMSLASAVVSNDSGLMHIAAALHRPLVVVYGSTSPGFTPPLNANHEVVSLDLDCSPCFKRECPLGHSNCLKQLPPSLVLQALERLPIDVSVEAGS